MSLTRNGPETGRGEGRVIASVSSLNVRSGTLRRRAILALSAIPLFLVAIWVRTPAIPRNTGSPARNETERVKAPFALSHGPRPGPSSVWTIARPERSVRPRTYRPLLRFSRAAHRRGTA